MKLSTLVLLSVIVALISFIIAAYIIFPDYRIEGQLEFTNAGGTRQQVDFFLELRKL
jgi:hypothetical protein